MTVHDDTVSNDDASVVEWVERTVGGRVVTWSRQPRWRRVWFLDVETADGTVGVVVRGERTDLPEIFPLRHEMTFQQLLEDHGIPVPHVYGWCDQPRAFAMATVPGQPHFDDTPSDDRDRIVDEYLQVLARLHTLPVDRFVEAGIIRGSTPADGAWVGLRQYEQHYRSMKVRPDPLLEFVLGWLRRHPLPPSDREAPIVWDSGQFHHDGKHLVSVLDLELGHLGDPMMDLAAWRMRDTVIPFGDFPTLYARYEALTGRPVDLAAVQWHHLMFTLTNQLAGHRALALPDLDTDYMTYAHWVSETNLHAVETMAEYLGIELEPVPVPEPVASPVAAAHALLPRLLRSIEITDDYQAYRLRVAFRLSRHLHRFDEIGAEVERGDIDDVAGISGRIVASWNESERILEEYVLADDGRHDADLVQLFHRRWQRYKALMGPPGSAMAAHHTLQPLGRSLLP